MDATVLVKAELLAAYNCKRVSIYVTDWVWYLPFFLVLNPLWRMKSLSVLSSWKKLLGVIFIGSLFALPRTPLGTQANPSNWEKRKEVNLEGCPRTQATAFTWEERGYPQNGGDDENNEHLLEARQCSEHFAHINPWDTLTKAHNYWVLCEWSRAAPVA